MRHSLVVLALLAAGVACRHDRDEDAANRARFTARDSALTLGPGDIEILNTDSSVAMALVGNRIVVRLSDKTMAQVRRETDTSAVADSGLEGSIERLVKRTVQSALSQQVQYPLSDIREARYENGEIKFETGGRRPRLLTNTKVGHRRLLESFRPDDAERFVAAVNARKRRTPL